MPSWVVMMTAESDWYYKVVFSILPLSVNFFHSRPVHSGELFESVHVLYIFGFGIFAIFTVQTSRLLLKSALLCVFALLRRL